MTYDPQAKRQRPKPATDGSAPVDALLFDANATASNAEDPSAAPAVTPEPANPPADKLMLSSALGGAAAALIGAVMLRYLWQRCSRRSRQK
ncbi:MAG: hypothetical protein KTU85_09505 [Acidimicrobiia bacterium]|nr:hypothetical protein [Acidimicrobiia bacterium]MCY4457979.1 hypothetical protein [Acidimicrobiaceae bacterium]